MSSKSIVSCIGRLTFPSLKEATRSNLDQEGTSKPKFKTGFLLKLGEDIAPFQAILVEAGTETWGPDRSKWPNGGNFRNKAMKAQGDKLFDQKGRPRVGYVAGAYYLDASSTRQPGIVKWDRSPILTDFEKYVYGGVYARLELNAYTYIAYDPKKPGVIINQGLAFGLLNVQVLGYGDPFGFVQEEAEKVFTSMPGPDPAKEGEGQGQQGQGGGAAGGQTAESLL